MNSEGAASGKVRTKLAAVGLALGLAACLTAACSLDNPGIAMPRGELAFPIALGLSTELTAEGAPRYLYVANSNFDLRFNGGNVQTYDLEKLAQRLERPPADVNGNLPGPCRTLGVSEPPLGEDQIVEAGTVLIAEAGPGLDDGGDAATAGGAEDAGDDASTDDAGGITADAGADAGAADAGAANAGAADAGAADAGAADAGALADSGTIVIPAGSDNPSKYGTAINILCNGRDSAERATCCIEDAADLESVRTSEVATDSYAAGLAVSPSGNRLYVPVRSRDRLLYIDVAGGELSCGSSGRCTRGVGVGTDALSGNLAAPQPSGVIAGKLSDLGFAGRAETFVATYHEGGQLSLFLDDGTTPQLADVLPSPPLLSGIQPRLMSVSVDPNRGVLMTTSDLLGAIDQVAPLPLGGGLLLARSAPLFVPDLAGSSDLRSVIVDPEDPSRLFALVRGPYPSFQQSVAFLAFDGAETSGARLLGAERIGAGPTKMLLATLGGRRLLFVACYDGRAIYVVDADRRELVSVIYELNGPFDMAFDGVRGLLYVADFRASVVRVIDVIGAFDRTKPPPRIVGTIGRTYIGGRLK